MAKQSRLLRQIHRLAAVIAGQEFGDAELLERFVRGKDAAAFTALVERHGAMVLGVCRRMLGNAADAEDAFQATFLVLVRRADSIRTASLGGWLHRVARSVAANLCRERRRRAAREQQAPQALAPDPAAEVSLREAQAALDEELAKLPKHYGAPLVLCYLEGLTRDEAAGQLGLTPGALHGRLERGRRLLRERLARRGFTWSAAFAGAALGGVSQAGPSPTLVLSLGEAAMPFAAGQSPPAGVVSAKALLLTKEALKGMCITKVKLGAVAAILFSGVLVAEVGRALNLNKTNQSPPAPDQVTAVGAQPPADAAAQDAKALEGEWHAVDAVSDGRPAPGKTNLRLVFRGDELTVGSSQPPAPGPDRTQAAERKMKYQLDPLKSPKEIRLTPLGERETGGPWVWIYSIEKGRLTVCQSLKDPGKPAAGFKTAEGDGLQPTSLRFLRNLRERHLVV